MGWRRRPSASSMRSPRARRPGPRVAWSSCRRRSPRPEDQRMRTLLNRREYKPAELLLVPMIDIFTVLVTFLLMTAVFSRIAIMQIDLPSSVAPKPEEPKVPYDELIQAMDAIRSVELPAADPLIAGAAVAPTPAGSPGAAAPQTVKVALFT